MMTTLLNSLGLFTYDMYMKQFESWVQEEKSSAKKDSTALVEYTSLNLARSNRLHKTVVLNEELKKAIKQIQHHYTWIVLTEAWCGDSAQNLPVIAEIARLNPEKIQLYILLRDENPELMNNYLTDNARAIPKLIVVDETMGREVLTWGPRPKPAQELLLSWKRDPQGKSWDEFEKELHSWYAKDRTNTLQSEFLTIFKELN